MSGIAGPDGGTTDKPVGTIWFAFRLGALTLTERQVFGGDRETVRRLTVRHALERVLERMSE